MAIESDALVPEPAKDDVVSMYLGMVLATSPQTNSIVSVLLQTQDVAPVLSDGGFVSLDMRT